MQLMQRGWITFAFVLTASPLPAEDPALAARAVDILERNCGSCHSDRNVLSGLRLNSRDALLRGGIRGPAIQPGDAVRSLLFQAVSHTGKLAMPPAGRLPESDIAALRGWIDQGAAWPAGHTGSQRTTWWAFQKPQRPEIPSDGAARHPIDRFLAGKLRAAGVQPSAEADKSTLLRRACFDLLGLPPTAQQASAFLNDNSPEAWERLIDSLLASEHYGEKWGRHWLDLVRYGDTSGFEQDPYALEAWRYRDYVIKSFNDDKPFDRFTKEQIAGDELWSGEPEARVGTGYYRAGANRDMLFKVEEQNAVEKLTDYVDTTSSVFLGLTVGCARCHDHKFDPISQRDYYRMQAIFAPAVNDRVFLEYNLARFYDLAANTREFKLRQIGAEIQRIEKPYRERLRESKIIKLPPAEQAALAVKPESRTPEQQAQATEAERKIKITQDEIRPILLPEDSERIQTIEKRLLAMFASYEPPLMAPGIIDVGREAPRTYIALRGNYETPGEEVQPGFLTALGGGDIPEPPLHAKTTGRRKALAEWIAGPENPLFARVMVNRIWQYHFGSGLVKTPSDLGTRAGKPSHPELLDWLAGEFAERKWSLKAMHKLILTSDAWRRSANPTESAARLDPANLLLSHMNRRRLAAEEIRDAVLEVSGTLNAKKGGSPVVPMLEAQEMFGMIGPAEIHWPVTPDPAEHTRRTIYMLQRRTFPHPMSDTFDSPDGVLSCARRNETTTALQSLAMLNGNFVMTQARALAATLAGKADPIDEAWLQVLGRKPNAQERAASSGLIDRQSARLASKTAAIAELVRGLLNLNEFLYVE